MKQLQRVKHAGAMLISALILSAVLLTSCSSGPTSTTTGPQGDGGKGCTKVGILLPETASSARWETKDHPLLVQAVTTAIPGVHIDYNNAQGSTATQLSQTETDLANGDCILIVGAHDSVAAASIVAKASAQNVPVIAYDRLIQSKNLSYYVSFENTKVGQLQGQYILDHYKKYLNPQKPEPINIAIISGSETDANSLLYSVGMHSVLDPLFATNVLKTVSENFTPNWDNNTAQAEMESALTDQQNNIQIAYAANDGMAGGVIAALSTARLSGKVMVTGQDATTAGIHNILAGTQGMTVYKPIVKEAQSTGLLVKALYNGSNISVLTHGQTTTTFNGGNIPSIFDTPIAVDINNIATTVIADHFITKGDVCAGIPAGTAGVC
ncbi:MAG: substrate-binding domain-containing protein [Ktedonobacteraceae bacterium]|nr:substrate-binding domain-containing protein [Ktedonobacteraceae bacterium]